MKKITLFFSIALALTSATSCKKEKGGCTDNLANNYSSDAEIDNGTCKFDRDAIIGNYITNGSQNCDGDSYPYSDLPILFTASSVAKNKVLLNLDGTNFPCTISGTSITLENKSESGVNYSGSGQVNGNVITLNLTEYDVADDVTCITNLTGTKQ
jgi:hypothetical protein